MSLFLLNTLIPTNKVELALNQKSHPHLERYTVQRFTVKVQLVFFFLYLFLVHWHHKNNHPRERSGLLYSTLSRMKHQFRIFAAGCLAFDAIIVTPCTRAMKLIIHEHTHMQYNYIKTTV